MKKFTISFFTMLAFLFLLATSNAQVVFDGEWACEYATYDASDNGTGYNTIDVGVVSEDEFVALVNRGTSFYLVGYRNATAGTGRLWEQEYAPSGFQMRWDSGFDQVFMEDPYAVAVDNNGMIYVANNDADHNILVYEMAEDTVNPAPYRLPVSGDHLWAIEVDGSGMVYVAVHDTTSDQSSVFVFDNLTNEPAWSDPINQTPAPLQEIILPANGTARGIAVNSEGTELYISNWEDGSILRYIGDAQTGFTTDDNFACNVKEEYMTSDSVTTVTGGPWGLKYMNGNNLLFAAAAADFQTSAGYEFSRIYTIHPWTGELLDTIDVAMWNFDMTGAYNARSGGNDPENASGYASTYNVDFDENMNIYSQSYFGWTAEKWAYDGELPTISSVEKADDLIPSNISLGQNYPNPFNPTTKINFSINEGMNVTISIFSITGELVGKLVNSEFFNPGNYEVSFNGKGLASGTYIYRLTAGGAEISKKMILIK